MAMKNQPEWTQAQHKKFSATMKAKREARLAAKATGATSGGQTIPLDAIPARAVKRAASQRSAPARNAPMSNHEVAAELLRLASLLLKGKP